MEDKIKATTSNVQELDNATESVASNELINKEADMTQQDINKDGNTSVTTEEVMKETKRKNNHFLQLLRQLLMANKRQSL